jgi:hypothetical protein
LGIAFCARLRGKQAEKGLRESEDAFAQDEDIRKPFLMTDPAKNQMLYINSAYETI